MQYNVNTADEYVSQIPEDRKNIFQTLRTVIKSNLPKEYEEIISYGMISYVVPFSIYPAGYHCDTSLPLGFMGIASQKHFIALYHMGMYADNRILDWFVAEYPKHAKTKLDMGKSCIRFKKFNDIPLDLIAELCQKMTVQEWIEVYESNFKRKK